MGPANQGNVNNTLGLDRPLLKAHHCQPSKRDKGEISAWFSTIKLSSTRQGLVVFREAAGFLDKSNLLIQTTILSRTMLCSFWALLAFSFVGKAVAMEEYLWWNHVKLVYCQQIKTRTIYKIEDLEENCVIKVDFYDKKVSDFISKFLFEPARIIRGIPLML